MTPIERIEAARAHLKHYSFHVAAAVSLLTPVEEPAAVKFVATNGRDLIFNPAFITSLSHDETIFVLASVGLDLLNEHLDSAVAKQPVRWAMACNYTNNIKLVENRIGHAPKLFLYDSGFAGMTAADVYEKLSGDDAPAKTTINETMVLPESLRLDPATTAAARESIRSQIRERSIQMQAEASAEQKRWIQDCCTKLREQSFNAETIHDLRRLRGHINVTLRKLNALD